MTIAVVGATGNTGRAVVNELRRLGQEPLCVVRNAEKAREVLGADAKTAVADLMDRAALTKALSGIDSVFLVTGHNPQMAEQQGNVIDAAAQAGVKHLVRLSAGRAVATADSPTLVGRAHYAVDEKMRGGVDHVALLLGHLRVVAGHQKGTVDPAQRLRERRAVHEFGNGGVGVGAQHFARLFRIAHDAKRLLPELPQLLDHRASGIAGRAHHCDRHRRPS